MMDDPVKYYEDYLSKKEGKGKWKDYWVVLRGTWMLFYASKDVADRNNFCGSLELLKNTKYSLGKRRSYSFPFYVTTPRGTHLFKCQSNLKRHQWMYVLGLAIKRYPPVPPPSFVPRATVQDDDGDHVSSWDTNTTQSVKQNTNNPELIQADDDDDDDDDGDDDDEISLPSGVIYVSTLPDDLSNVDGDMERSKGREMMLNSINRENTNMNVRVVPVSAVLTTGITGATTVVKERSNSDLMSNSSRLNISKLLAKSVSKSTGSINEESGLHQYSVLSSSSWQDERPSTSPFSSSFQRSPLSRQPMNINSNNLKFSRHMTSSAPDVKSLAADNK